MIMLFDPKDTQQLSQGRQILLNQIDQKNICLKAILVFWLS